MSLEDVNDAENRKRLHFFVSTHQQINTLLNNFFSLKKIQGFYQTYISFLIFKNKKVKKAGAWGATGVSQKGKLVELLVSILSSHPEPLASTSDHISYSNLITDN